MTKKKDNTINRDKVRELHGEKTYADYASHTLICESILWRIENVPSYSPKVCYVVKICEAENINITAIINQNS